MNLVPPSELLQTLPEKDPLRGVLTGNAWISLLTAARLSRRGAFLIALYNTPASRQSLINEMTRRLAPLPVSTFTFTKQQADPRQYLQQITAQARQQTQVVNLCNIEEAWPQAARWLDLLRDTLSGLPHTLVLWVRAETRPELMRQAPNFFSRHSGVFDLRLDAPPEAHSAALEAVGSLQTGFEDLDDWQRKYELYQGMLQEYEKAPSTLPEPLIRLHLQVGKLEFARAEYPQADAHFEAAFCLIERDTPLDLRAETLFYRGQMAYQLHSDYTAAVEMYRQSGEAYRQVGDRLGEANVLKAIGDVQNFRDERDAALESYAQALALFRQVGARLGEANVLQAIGALYLLGEDPAKSPEGTQSLDAALSIYKTIGALSGQANTYWIKTQFYAKHGQLKEALENAEQAYALGNRFAPGHPITENIGKAVQFLRQAMAEQNQSPQ